ncbi:MAG: methyltransferase domain-containing protein [Candidatus Theseobacter exili]|nr:methyltransferase domain-containing protein [Candidatus Theseobacter exili]
MNSFIGKKILSIIRDANYAHPGGKEAIELTFQNVPKNKNRLMLDVGCGRGGTAHYLNANGWGDVVGVDIESDSIEYAKQKYASLDFIACNIVDVSKYLKRQFDLLYLFNSFYAFDNQQTVLESLCKVANPLSTLLIFDYIDYGDYNKEPIMEETLPFLPCPIKMDYLENMMEKIGWSLTKTMDITPKYEHWYSQFMDKVESKKKEILETGGAEALDTVCRLYGDLLESIQKGKLGGIIVEAKPSI